MTTKEQIIELIEDKIIDIEVANNKLESTDVGYKQAGAKIEILEQLLNEIIG